MSVDPLADKFFEFTPYHYTVNNPINVIDPDGRDTLNIHRGQLNEKLSDEFTNVWDLTFSLTKNGVTEEVSLPDGTPKLYMIGNKEYDSKGDNLLTKDSYVLKFEDMSISEQAGWDNTIRVTEFGVFIHPGNSSSSFRGCKGVCKDFNIDATGFRAKNTRATLNEIRGLYDKYADNLTGSKFLLQINSIAPAKKMSKEQINAIRALNEAGGVIKNK